MAKRAGVSVATVSYVINGKDVVSDEVKQRVLDAINEMGYTVNNNAKALATNKTTIIALNGQEIAYESNNKFLVDFIAGVSDKLFQYNYNLLISPFKKEAIYEEVVQLANARKVDGFILLSATVDDRRLSFLVERDIPFVLVGRSNLYKKINYIDVNDEEGGYEATTHFIKLGHQKIAHIAAPLKNFYALNRLRGYVNALREHGIEINRDYIVKGDLTLTSGYEAAKKLFALEDKPTAIFSANDFMAIGAIRYMRENDIKVPEDVVIIGCDNTDLGRNMFPSLTTIDQKSYMLGYKAAEGIVNIINGKIKSGAFNVIIKPEIIYRESCPA